MASIISGIDIISLDKKPACFNTGFLSIKLGTMYLFPLSLLSMIHYIYSVPFVAASVNTTGTPAL
jgi:hypothetical protein